MMFVRGRRDCFRELIAIMVEERVGIVKVRLVRRVLSRYEEENDIAKR